jgi:hypothetical protein
MPSRLGCCHFLMCGGDDEIAKRRGGAHGDLIGNPDAFGNRTLIYIGAGFECRARLV